MSTRALAVALVVALALLGGCRQDDGEAINPRPAEPGVVVVESTPGPKGSGPSADANP